MQSMFVSWRPFEGASSCRWTRRESVTPGLILPLIMVLLLVGACSKKEKPLDPDRDTASEEMLTEADRDRLA